MGVLATKAYNQEATYWGSPTQGGFGDITFAEPRLIMVRWEDKVELFTNMEGQEGKSRAIVYCMEELEVGGYLARGDYATTPELDPTAVGDAMDIQRFDSVPDLRGLNTTWKAYL